MEYLVKAKERIRNIIAQLDNDEYSDKYDRNSKIEFLRQEYSRRESRLIVRAEMLKEGLGTNEDDLRKKAEIDTILCDGLAMIKDSSYLPAKCKYPFRHPRGRPTGTKKISHSRANVALTESFGRFRFSIDYSRIKDVQHAGKDYEIQSYDNFTAPKAVEVFKELINAAKNKKSEGWVHVGDGWRGAFQCNPYKRFKRQQIQIESRDSNDGKKRSYWRFYTDGDFDELSPAGKFYKRNKGRCK